MTKAFLFHNPRCSKSRQALNLLEKEKENFEVFMYLDEKLEKDFLKEIIQKLGMSPRDLLRTGESAYKENNLKDSNISEDFPSPSRKQFENSNLFQHELTNKK